MVLILSRLLTRKLNLYFGRFFSERRPQDGILGEEFPDVIGVSGLTWVLDPIDGTRGFISGTPTWGMLIGVNDGTQPVFGIIDQPFTAERFIGGFGQSVLQHNGHEQALKVRSCTSLQNAVLFSTMPEVGTESETELFNKVAEKCKLTRFGLDCYAYALLAMGQIDLVIEADLNIYDIQGPLAVVEAAGWYCDQLAGGGSRSRWPSDCCR